MFTFIVFTLFLITFSTCDHHIPNDNLRNSTIEPEMRHDPAGSFIKLKCATNICNENTTFKWEFKACGPDFPNIINCQNSENKSWVVVSEKNKRHCSSTYTIKKGFGRHSGLYRCSVYSPSNNKTSVLKLYQVHIIEPYNLKTGLKPKIIDIQPLNITALENTKIVIQCKVFGDNIFPPEIWWLKHLDPRTLNSSSIPYNNKVYLKLNSSQMELKDFIYVSKLIIEQSNKNDSGIYSCFAVNIYGTTGKDVYVDVITMGKHWQGSKSIPLLFLIPFTFALFLIFTCICVHYHRKKKLKKLNDAITCECYKYQVELNRNYLYRQNRIPHASQRII